MKFRFQFTIQNAKKKHDSGFHSHIHPQICIYPDGFLFFKCAFFRTQTFQPMIFHAFQAYPFEAYPFQQLILSAQFFSVVLQSFFSRPCLFTLILFKIRKVQNTRRSYLKCHHVDDIRLIDCQTLQPQNMKDICRYVTYMYVCIYHLNFILRIIDIKI